LLQTVTNRLLHAIAMPDGVVIGVVVTIAAEG
jgi:hypothetical protein